MVTVAAAARLVPPAPVQVNEYDVVAVSAPVDTLPLGAFAPAKVPPTPVQAVALVELQVSVDVPPLAIADGCAVNVAPGTILTVAAALPVPPAPVQLNEYSVGTVSGPVLCELLNALAPLQPPVAVHVVALVELHVSVAAPPAAIGFGLAVRVTVGGVAGVTVTVAVAALPAPPAPRQVNEYVVLAASAPVDTLPLGACAPANVPPVPVQAVALVELQVSVAAPPAVTAVGLAVSVAVAGGGVTGVTVTVAVAALLAPPAPVQVTEYVAVAVSAPVDRLPLVARAPANVPPVPVQAVALVELQVSVAAPPAVTAAGLAVSVAVAGGVTAVTVTVTVAGLLLPPAPVQVNEYVAVAVSAPVDRLPPVERAPANAPPVPVQAVALVELQVSVVALPAVIEVAAALSDAVGTAGGGGSELCDPPQAAISSDPKTGRTRIQTRRTPSGDFSRTVFDSSRTLQSAFAPTPLPYD
jgi:hypothetical protein